MLATAIFFIFVGVPLLYCLSSVPAVVVMIAGEAGILRFLEDFFGFASI